MVKRNARPSIRKLKVDIYYHMEGGSSEFFFLGGGVRNFFLGGEGGWGVALHYLTLNNYFSYPFHRTKALVM